MEQAIPTHGPGRYAPGVAGHRVSTTLDEETLRLVRDLAQWRGLSVSAWLARAARREAWFDDGLRAVGQVEKEIGPFTEEERRKADEYLDSIGIPRPPE
jgi:hypothetical protein